VKSLHHDLAAAPCDPQIGQSNRFAELDGQGLRDVTARCRRIASLGEVVPAFVR
jgi:hypothetical protein